MISSGPPGREDTTRYPAASKSAVASSVRIVSQFSATAESTLGEPDSVGGGVGDVDGVAAEVDGGEGGIVAESSAGKFHPPGHLSRQVMQHPPLGNYETIKEESYAVCPLVMHELGRK